MTYIYGKYTFVLHPGGAVDVSTETAGPVQFYPGSVVTYNDLVCWAMGYLAAKEPGGWGSVV